MNLWDLWRIIPEALFFTPCRTWRACFVYVYFLEKSNIYLFPTKGQSQNLIEKIKCLPCHIHGTKNTWVPDKTNNRNEWICCFIFMNFCSLSHIVKFARINLWSLVSASCSRASWWTTWQGKLLAEARDNNMITSRIETTNSRQHYVTASEA